MLVTISQATETAARHATSRQATETAARHAH